ncbi:serine hydrolase domain-containing protein [Carboxylicivirga sp. RSCT41]|uniref:serine hydrolase domain-containing protein n=1 Tax=Carboxylicivirga agarovorans TaxID=3417570 RepID=UPI003D330E5C
MKTYFLGILLLVFSISALSISRADTLLNQLSVEEKVAMLFVKIPDNTMPDSVLVGNTRFDSYSVLNIRKGYKDELALSFPNEETFRTIAHQPTISNLLNDACSQAETKGYDGIVTFDKLVNVSRLYIGSKSIKDNRYVQIIDFPCELLDELLTNAEYDREENYPLAYIPAFNMWQASVNKRVCFSDLLDQDLLFWEDADKSCYEEMVQAVYDGKVQESILDRRVIKLLNNNVDTGVADSLVIQRDDEINNRYKAYTNSITIYQRKAMFPVLRVDSLTLSINARTNKDIAGFVSLSRYYQPKLSENDSSAYVQLLLCDDVRSLSKEMSLIEGGLTQGRKYNTLVYIGELDSKTYRRAGWLFDAIITMPQAINESPELLAEAIYGGIQVSGISPVHKELKQLGFERIKSSKTRLAFSSVAHTFHQDSIAKIDSIVFDAIKKKATPGAQLMVVKGGDIILQKSYGYHTYKRRQKVTNDDLYDVASVTKLAVTFPIVMMLYEKGQLNLDARLPEYLAEIDTTDKADITIRELLLHQSGLISYIPFHYKALDRESLRKRSLYSRHYSGLYNIRVDSRLYQNKYARYRKDVFSRKQHDQYNRQLTSGMFMNEEYVDSMYAHIYASPLRDYKDYRYSDLGYYILQRIIEKEENESLDSIYYSRISRLLGAENLVYKPLDGISSKRIVPTEKDLGFRKTLLDGYVHDQGAAMLGGVAAHAGLFANAGDLAKLGQMLLNEGKYGGLQYVSPRTIGTFTTSVNHGNRRGLGVDKPELDPDNNSHVSQKVSQASYGHTGFTGTILWIDPENDIIYIFLSNRIHPHSYNKKLIKMNVRTKIQDVIYNSLN